MILNRNIVIKREGNKILLPTVQRKEVNAPTNTPSNMFAICRIISYNENLGILGLKLSYESVSINQFQLSIEVNSELLSPLIINTIVFENKHTYFELPDDSINTTTFYKKDLSYKETLSKVELASITNREESKKLMPKEKEIINLQIELPINELKFLDGKVCFEYYIKQHFRKLPFEVGNSFLKKEFDSIKNYFPKILDVRKFTIKIQIEHLDGKILSQSCTSSHISMITDSLFELVEDLYIADHITNGSRDEIVSLNEIALDTSAKIGSDNIKDTDWLMNKLIDPKKTKHHNHLSYLSKHNLSSHFNLRLTGKPLSFIFLLPMSQGYCLIWETYSTEEATYAWKIGKSSDSETIQVVEEIVDRIKWLRAHNKKTYLKTKPEGFIKIEHNYSGEDLGFKKWKMQLEEFMLS